MLNQGRYNCKILIFKSMKIQMDFFTDTVVHVAKFSI